MTYAQRNEYTMHRKRKQVFRKAFMISKKTRFADIASNDVDQRNRITFGVCRTQSMVTNIMDLSIVSLNAFSFTAQATQSAYQILFIA